MHFSYKIKKIYIPYSIGNIDDIVGNNYDCIFIFYYIQDYILSFK